MKILKRILTIFIALIVILAALAGGGFYLISRQSFPQTSGSLQMAGLNGKVEIIRDKFGVPNIYADTSHDLFMAQGFVHAQDRFFQLEFARRVGQGRISELFGKSALSQDKFIRTLGWHRAAQAEAAALTGETREVMEAYAAGINAYLDKNADKASLEFNVLGLIGRNWKPEKWTTADTIAWGKVMAWNLGGNMDEELTRAALLAKGGADMANTLLPPYPKTMPVIAPSAQKAGLMADPLANAAPVSEDNALALLNLSQSVSAMMGVLHDTDIGSNDWVVAGSRTTSGKPLLANDPHLAIQMPSIWYQIGLHCRAVSPACPYDVSGVSFAAAPGVIIGHNTRIAWGVTNVNPDVQDVFIEKPNPANPDEFEYMGKFEKAQIIAEKINVAGGDPVTVNVRVTRHGPIMNDVSSAMKDQQPMALSWTALRPSNLFQSVLKIDRAGNWAQFRDALRDWSVPAQNFVFADVDGNIGYQMPGDVPIRKSGNGSMPMPGWTGEAEWTGFIPFDDLPSVFNPPEGYIATANNAVIDADVYKPFITGDWDYGFRARRIVEMIKAKDKLTIDDFKQIQGDTLSGHATDVLPFLDGITINDDPLAKTALDELRKWDRRSNKDSAGALIYEAFWRQLGQNIYGDELGTDLSADALDRGTAERTAVTNALKDPSAHWWDDVTTASAKETREQILVKSLKDTAAFLKSKYGDDVSKWKWGNVHTVTFRNSTLGNSGVSLIDSMFNRGPFAANGASAAVNNVGSNADFSSTSGPSLRMIVDMSNMDNSLLIHTTGQSGHTYNPHYDDMIQKWLDIQYNPFYFARADVEKNSEGTLALNP